MKTKIITVGLIICTTLLSAQTANKPATVRIKKVESINGVEKVTDTTFTTNDPSSIKIGDGNIDIQELVDSKDGKVVKTIIINNEDNGNGNKTKLSEKEINEHVKKALKEAGIDENTKGNQKVIIINNDSKGSDNKNEKHTTKVIMVKVDITNADDADVKRISKQTGETDGKLKIEKMNFYPNPSNGKFNLSFNLPDKGDAEVNILNMEGKSVFTEKLIGFTGNYEREIDISKNAKGIYFVRVEQGKHAQVKKIVLD